MELFKFEQRKAIHYALLSAIILLQLLVVATWYNETRLSEAFNKMAAADSMLSNSNKVNFALIASQKHFNDYITHKDDAALARYAQELGKADSLMATLGHTIKDNPDFRRLTRQKDSVASELRRLKASIDSIVDGHIGGRGGDYPQRFDLHDFGSKKILDDIETKTYVNVKEAQRKGFFSRIADAFSGKTAVKQEYINTVVKIKYNDKILTGDVEKQIGTAMELSEAHYRKEFARLKQNFSNVRQSDLALMRINNQLLVLTAKLAADYNASGLLPNDGKDVRSQYASARSIRNYSIVLIILLMMAISVILFKFTRIAFDYEARLREAQEKISRSLDFKNRITGMISHEIRSPLHILSLYSRKARERAKDDASAEVFRDIEFTTQSLLMLSQQILEYSRDENRPLALAEKPFHIKAELQNIMESLATMTETKGNQLKVDYNLMEYEVTSDAAKIHQLCYNIVGNANKFTEGGVISVGITTQSVTDFEVDLKVVVSDTGVGIASDDLAHIFDSYYQGTVSNDVNDLGVGLGLNICREIVELFDGNIAISSEENKGTIVTLNLVLART
ncbi:hypothetical protein FLLO111716_01280 [Flavobacterium longum]|uniref:sensor histidine kinase n=1 Tax=Flavobacterium longum TaxID=1299340 RepID=UPI0039EBCDE4